MKRNEVDKQYKWDLESIYETDEKWEQDFAFVKGEIAKIEKFKGKLSDKKALKECLVFADFLYLSLSRLYAYAHMRRDEDTANNFYSAMTDRCEQLWSICGHASAFMSSEITAQDEDYLISCINDEEFSDYDYMLNDYLRKKKYILSENEEKILALASVPMGAFMDIFNKADNVDLPFSVINVRGEEVKLSHGKYSVYLQDRDQKVRETAFKGYYEGYKKILNILTSTYAGSVKKDNFVAKARGYEDCLQMAMFNENVPKAVYENLIESVHEFLPDVHRYMALRKKFLGYEKYNMYDMFVSVADADLSVDYDQAFEMVKEGLKPLGEEYGALLQSAKDERWIDVFETDNKRCGAYSSGTYGTKPFVLLNYSKTAHDVFTIAHELGHSIHSYYSRKSQPFAKSHYEIFVAEVASTVNEVLLLKDMIKKATDKQFKKYLLAYYLDMFRTTVFRQTMFAEFEKEAHDMEARGEALTTSALSDMYYALNKKYYGPSVEHNEEIAFEWARIPHFYDAFYVYKYATGLTSAVSIARNILANEEYFNSYKKFLCAGSSASPYEILTWTGVDLASKKPFEDAMKEFRDTLAQLEAIDEE